MKRKTLSILLIVSMLTASSGVSYALGTPQIYEDNGLTEKEVATLAKEIEHVKLKGENPAEENSSVDEIEEFVGGIDGVKCLNAEEDALSVEAAVNEIFNDEEVSQMDVEQRSITEGEGERFVTETYKEGETAYVKTYSEDKTKMSLLKVEGDTVSTETYLYDAESGEYKKQFVELVCDETGDAEMKAQAQGITYNSKVSSAVWKDTKFWYRTGQGTKKDKGKTYLKIGCSAQYRIRTDNLSERKETKCDNYRSCVKSSKSYYTKGNAYLAGTGLSIGVVLGIITSNLAFPPSTIVTIVIGVLGGGVAVYKAVNALVDSYEKWLDAKDYYNIIKTYGVKL